MAKEDPAFPRKLSHDQVRVKCDVNLLVELPKDSPYPELLEVQNGVGRANLALIFPASGGRDGYCALFSERESRRFFRQLLLRLCQVKAESSTIDEWNHFIEATAFRLKSSVTLSGCTTGSP